MKVTAEEIIQEMVKQGMRITDQRKTLAGLFAEEGSALTPKAVYEYMGRLYPGLSFDTVYRNLRLMHEMGVLEQFVLEDGIKFRVSCGENHHHHHIICMNCDKTYSVTYCPMDAVSGLPEGFQVVKHKFEIYGLCEDCAARRDTPS
ncbi:Fur family transcriptional regulator [Paenibacillus aurantius]|uniref:Fur family transcriptional regulator n=1 Tax=Paenibacillus aurantius TaxID=2918900 RepID=A0AA96L9Z7_9BACL|nr:Fur family transcriptional regulator [Paenibacillus aurantius]WNQ09423.1 Fur family transcriptional regulator [Paenibacillus aurantius]